MKRMFVFLLSFLAFTSCKKDILRNYPDGLLNRCRVEKLIIYGTIETDTLTFQYNQWDNPVYAERSSTTDFLYLNYVFKYDSRNRLTDFIGIYNALDEFDGINYEFWHRYAYDNKDRIIADTSYIPGFDETPSPGPGQVSQYTDSIEYDAKNRIVKAVSRDLLFGTVTTHYEYYHYNSNDNLESSVRTTSIAGNPAPPYYDTTRYTSYDNKVNPRRTNKLWMYIDKNYSLNNPVTAQEYNNVGLPLRFNLHYPDYMNILIGLSAGEIEYQCK